MSLEPTTENCKVVLGLMRKKVLATTIKPAESGGSEVRSAFVTGLNRAFLVSAGLMVAALLVSLIRKDTAQATSSSEQPTD